MEITPDKVRIVHAMFVKTADQNYIMARHAFFENYPLDFWWLSLHAAEKYSKAVLLMNGRSTKDLGHNVVELRSAALALDPRLNFGELADPKIAGLHWHSTTTAEFFENRLNVYGNPNNRYATYGSSLFPCDIMKVDQVMWESGATAAPSDTLSHTADRPKISTSLPRWSQTPRVGGWATRARLSPWSMAGSAAWKVEPSF